MWGVCEGCVRVIFVCGWCLFSFFCIAFGWLSSVPSIRRFFFISREILKNRPCRCFRLLAQVNSTAQYREHLLCLFYAVLELGEANSCRQTAQHEQGWKRGGLVRFSIPWRGPVWYCLILEALAPMPTYESRTTTRKAFFFSYVKRGLRAPAMCATSWSRLSLRYWH